MGLFLNGDGCPRVIAAAKRGPLAPLVWAMRNRAEKHAGQPGLFGKGERSDWWHIVSDYLTETAMIHAISPTAALATWLRDTTLGIVRRSEADWVGPAFRDHQADPPVGHLETAHLTWSCAIVLDLAGDVFSGPERDEVIACLRQRGMVLCRRWLERCSSLNNWHAVLNAGVGVAAAVLDDPDAMDMAGRGLAIEADSFQPDGSYGESLQYAGYAAYAMMLCREALIRRDVGRAPPPDSERLAGWMRWCVHSHFYCKGLAGWDAQPRPRAANFNDSAAIFHPSGDLLLYVAARHRTTHPVEAGLARWMFDRVYSAAPNRGTFDAGSFGFRNIYGFLTPLFLPDAADPITPEQAGLAALASFGNGDTVARDGWGGRTILATHGGGEPLHTLNHQHADLNSFILVHNTERLLVDPGHSCYRGLVHEMIETRTITHNTCTFDYRPAARDGIPEHWLHPRTLDQSRGGGHRRIVDGQPGPLLDRKARRLIAAESGPVRVIGSEAGATYPWPIERFARFWILAGPHVLFIVDHIVAAEPVTTTWSWLFNNRDGELELKMVPPDRLVARRGDAGMKLFMMAPARQRQPVAAFVHDHYRPQPIAEGGHGENSQGSGMLVRWTETDSKTSRVAVIAIAVDDYGIISQWHLRSEGSDAILESPGGAERWALRVGESCDSLSISEQIGKKSWRVSRQGDGWCLE